jgi:hypothetical protein
MSDPTTPDRTSPKAPTPSHDGKSDRTASAAKPTGDSRAAGDRTPADSNTTARTSTASTSSPGAETPTTTATDAKSADGGKAGAATLTAKKKWYRRVLVPGPWLTVGGVVVVLVVLALIGYLWGLGPLSRLNTERGITPPAKLGGLERITDQEIRGQLQLDQTRDALSRINNGKKATVEAYGNITGNRMFVVIALRGKVDIDKTVSDSGATPDKIKKVGHSTCVESTGNLPTQCYRGSNTLTVIAQSANDGVTVDAVEPVAEEAFNAMK